MKVGPINGRLDMSDKPKLAALEPGFAINRLGRRVKCPRYTVTINGEDIGEVYAVLCGASGIRWTFAGDGRYGNRALAVQRLVRDHEWKRLDGAAK